MRILLLLPYANLHLEKFISCIQNNFETDIYVHGTSRQHRKYIRNNQMQIESKSFINVFTKYLSKSYDLIITHGIFYPPTYFLCINTRAPLIVLSEEIRTQYSSKFLIFMKRIILKRLLKAHKFFLFELGSLQVRQSFQQLAQKQVDAYSYGYFSSVTPTRNKKNAADKPVKFIFAGQLIERKNIAMLLQAIQHSEALQNGKAILSIAGEGPMANLVKTNTFVRYLGNMGKNELMQELQQSDVCILPSAYEGWGAIINEACAAGCALLVSKHVMAATVFLEQGKNGYIVELTAEDIAKHIDMLTENSDILNQMKEYSFQKFLTLDAKHDETVLSYIKDATTCTHI